jgi:hypothetical protein
MDLVAGAAAFLAMHHLIHRRSFALQHPTMSLGRAQATRVSISISAEVR